MLVYTGTPISNVAFGVLTGLIGACVFKKVLMTANEQVLIRKAKRTQKKRFGNV